MKKYISIIALLFCGMEAALAQSIGGKCGKNVGWSFDGTTLSVFTTKEKVISPMENYGMEKKEISPWLKKGVGNEITKVVIGKEISSIGSCSFTGCKNLKEVVFEGRRVRTIGWGAFLDCPSLKSISLPSQLKEIGQVAFARCKSLGTVSIPSGCTVKEQAFAGCDGLTSISCPSNCVLEDMVFAGEKYENGQLVRTLYSGTIRGLPGTVDQNNCHKYGLSPEAVMPVQVQNTVNFMMPLSAVDSIIPSYNTRRNSTHVLVIGNQDYRFADPVPFALHDAYVFQQYCHEALGVPEQNIIYMENATKEMMDEALERLDSVNNPSEKRLIVYYAGHGAPVFEKGQDSPVPYLWPTDVRYIRRGIPLGQFYNQVSNLGFEQTVYFFDACFSQLDKARGVVRVEQEKPKGRSVAFSATGKNQLAHPYGTESHGLFTYYLLSALQTKGDNVTFGELSDLIRRNVTTTSKKEMPTEQQPTTICSEGIEQEWRELSF